MAKLLGLQTESDKLRNMDFLRFVASAGIVFLHSHPFFFSPDVRRLPNVRMDGFQLFVELFFVISGFIIATVGCYFGMKTKGGTQGVGRSTTQAVVYSSVLIIASDFLISRLMIGVFGR